MMKKHFIFWLSVSGFIAIFFFLFGEVLTPFIIGIIFAYLLEPLTHQLHKLGCKRSVASLIILSTFFILLTVFILLIFPIIQKQLSDLIDWLPKAYEKIQHIMGQASSSFTSSALSPYLSSLQEIAKDNWPSAVKYFFKIIGQLISSGAALVNIFALIFVAPVVSFYFMRDWPILLKKIHAYIPIRYRKDIHYIAERIDSTLSGFIRGQLSVCVILACYYAITLSLAQLKFGLTIGIFIGFLSFIPYLGAIFGLLLSVGLAFLQFSNDWVSISIIFIIFIIGQMIEGNFLSPVLVGSRVNLHPVWIIFSLFAFSHLFGFTGALLAIPVAATIGVIIRFLLDKYKDTQFYKLKKPV